ncbi:PmoA family protein [Blastopirellula sp. J2-11]|uniref:PmoA family protein n=1 Tax=Blastopirellula sp. J2-11 TaxID=2943192 RepID=UPI0021C616D3|nr:PmoA family protein [Blastopirellula sp. J2-11]UUO05753.1 PmoA family protein [Blastopirellula sp. J2-11]
MFRTLIALALTLLVCDAALAASLKLQITAADQAEINIPVTVAIPTATAGDAQTATVSLSDGTKLTGQLTAPRLLSSADAAKERELTFVVPKLDAGAKLTATVEFGGGASGEQFRWKDEPGKSLDLLYGDKPVLRYMYEALDDSSAERRHETFKVYHHVFDMDGENLLTKGPGGLFQHHRGLFYGFNRISYSVDGQKQNADVWHCNHGESQAHVQVLKSEAGPVLGRQLLQVEWRGRNGEAFAEEQRELTVYRTPEGRLIEFASRLNSKVEDLKLDGDPQHAGFQFRATQFVPDNTAKKTFYIRPDGKGKPGAFRNWPGQKEHVDLPWNVLVFEAFDKTYSSCYLDRPTNPKPARFSERDYGRFGSYFATDVSPEKPLDVNYRIYLTEGEIAPEAIAESYASFNQPPQVSIVE